MHIKILVGIIYYVVKYNVVSCDQIKQIHIQSDNWKTEVEKFSFKKLFLIL